MLTKNERQKRDELFAKGRAYCSGCLEDKSLDRFGKNKGKRYGVNAYCKECSRNSVVKSKYGLSTAEYRELIQAQEGKCAICAGTCSTNQRLCVDHCHKTGAVRGLLCNNCNRAIGLLQDDPNLLQQAKDYLTQGDIHE
jgi:hypothetical protein